MSLAAERNNRRFSGFPKPAPSSTNQHFSGCSIISCNECIKIETACNRFTKGVPAVPIDGTRFVDVETSRLIPDCKASNEATIGCMDLDSHISRYG